MTQRATELLRAALELSEAERVELLEGIEESLEDGIPPDRDIDRMTDQEFEAELTRRAQELDRDPSAGIPLEEALRNLKQR